MENLNIQKNSSKQNKFVHVALVVGLVIVINLFINYALSFIYQEPVYDVYLTRTQVIESYDTKEACLTVGGQWTENMQYKTEPVLFDEDVQKGYCDPNYTKSMDYEKATKTYDLKVFITLMVLGILMMIFGITYSHVVLSPAFTWAGVLSYIVASMRYWSSATSGVRVIILGLALAALIWVALKKFGDKA